ncbi:MAG: quinoprotein relay system zinc metallohydrolase 2 [Methylibium sp.]|nr:quinoprotein relay system zinc metallohydrolase 2 [Methylibium sp.]MBA3590186.1 quinoprotein relay system zinc metallohydrolase 2 [Methylibium sp.]
MPMAALALALLSGCSSSAREAGNPPGELQQIAPGVYLRPGVLEDWGPANRGQVANTGFIVGERCVAVIDTGGTRAGGEALAAALRRTTALPVCYIINTHAHPDHVLGNEAFVDANAQAEGPQFVGHRRLPAALAARGPFYLNALKRDFGPADAQARIVPPTLLVESTLELDLGNRRLTLRAWPTAHTDADLSVFDERTATLWLGDLLFTDHTPVLDGQLKGWLAALEELRGWRVATVVPGHGAPGSDWPAALDPQQRYLERLQADTRAAIKSGLTLREAVERIGPNRSQWALLDVFHKRNVTAAYAELEWE